MEASSRFHESVEQFVSKGVKQTCSRFISSAMSLRPQKKAEEKYPSRENNSPSVEFSLNLRLVLFPQHSLLLLQDALRTNSDSSLDSRGHSGKCFEARWVERR